MMLSPEQIKLVNLQLAALIESSRTVMLIRSEALSIADPIIKAIVIRAFDSLNDEGVIVTEAVEELAEAEKVYDHTIEQYNIAVLVDDVIRTMQYREEQARIHEKLADVMDEISTNLQAAAESNDVLSILDHLGLELVVEMRDPQDETSDNQSSIDGADDDDDESGHDNNNSTESQETEVVLIMEVDWSSIDDSSDDSESADDQIDDEDEEEWVSDQDDGDDESEVDPPPIEQREQKLPTFSQSRQTFVSGDE